MYVEDSPIWTEGYIDNDPLYRFTYNKKEEMLNGSFVIGFGLEREVKRTDIGLRFLYSRNFNNIVSGQYQITNPLDKSETISDYTISGNYFGVLCSVSIPKFK